MNTPATPACPACGSTAAPSTAIGAANVCPTCGANKITAGVKAVAGRTAAKA